jgi:hypothetical protein
MAMSDTETLIEFYGRPENAPLIMEFVADAGGDSAEYGINDVDSVSPMGMASALQTFTQQAVTLGVITEAAVASASAADDVDWTVVSEVAERTLTAGFVDL